MKKYANQLLYFSIAIIFFLTFATVYGVLGKDGINFKNVSFTRGNIVGVKPTIKKDTVIIKEIRYICGDKVRTKIPTTSRFIGMDFSSLAKIFTPAQGWNIDDSVKNNLVIARVDNNLCPYHKGFRHLGIDQGFLAIFEGPLGYNNTVLQRENITLSSLPEELQKDLRAVMEYNQQPPDIQGKLKSTYEFDSEAQLNTAMENFDEYKE